MSCVYEGTSVPIDLGLKIEAKYFLSLLRGSVAPNMIRTLFVNKGRADKLARRPQGVPKAHFKKIGMLGAGMMGAAIAYVAATNGIEVVLIDRDVESAERGKGYAKKLVEGAVTKRRMSQADGEALLAPHPSGHGLRALADVDYIIEAVFEDRAIKADVTKRVEAVIRPGVIFGSNTSTLPITGLAEASSRPQKFIGIHFFSPAEKMPLVEIITGQETSDEALAVTLDFVQAIKKTPIVVNDGRGFFTSRFCGCYIGEGEIMLTEGIPAPLIENAGKLAGMPVGPLALADETAIDLGWKIHKAAENDLGAAYKPSAAVWVMETMYVKNGRAGPEERQGLLRLSRKGAEEPLAWPRRSLSAQAGKPVAIDRGAEEAAALRASARRRALHGGGRADRARGWRCRRHHGLGLRALHRRPDQPRRYGWHREVHRGMRSAGAEIWRTLRAAETLARDGCEGRNLLPRAQSRSLDCGRARIARPAPCL